MSSNRNKTDIERSRAPGRNQAAEFPGHPDQLPTESVVLHSRTLLPAAFAALLCAALPARAAEISGAGATFPYPIYAKWAEAYKEKTGTAMNYQSIGSGGGIKQIEAKTVDFGASDMPLAPDKLATDNLQQFPMVMGGVVPVVNLAGIKPGELKLDGAVLAGMYLGTITNWNDKAIAALNPGLTLPDKAIATVHRSDGSGTNFIFTHYLSSIDADFKAKVGENTSVEFPAGLGGKGNEGVAAIAGRTDGAIGYVEYAYALQNKMTYAQLKNHDGNYVSPDASTFQAAAANADWSKAPGFYLLLTDQPGKDSWPITGATFILMHHAQDKPDSAREVLSFFDWAYHNGGQLAEQLDYVPMPASVVTAVEQSWKTITGTDGKPVWTGHAS
jgi:phosphate transport system substrate-binding protein